MPHINGRYVPYGHASAVRARRDAEENEIVEEVKKLRKKRAKKVVERATVAPPTETAEITLEED